MSFVRLSALAVVAAALLCGCQKPVNFPADSLADQAKAVGAVAAYDVSGKGKADFFLYADSQGRISRLGYAYDGADKPQRIVDMDTLDRGNYPHLVIILDGIGYDVLKEFYDKGRLRYFHKPSRVIAPYPTLTDPCMEDLLGYIPCSGFEAMYFDRRKNKVVGGSDAYLSGQNMPYDRLLNYRASLIMDAVSYVAPWDVYRHELNNIKKMVDKRGRQEYLAYIVSVAGMGTKHGADGQRQCLEELERLLNQLMYETQGQLRLTLLADHGHSYTPSTRIPLEDHLQQNGWRVSERLDKPRDVVYIRFGLETYAAMYTQEAAELAADLVKAKGVELASYVQEEAVVVLDGAGGKAIVRRSDNAYKYEAVSGDPLKLKAALSGITPDSQGYYQARDELKATADSEYPAAMQRIWRAHFAMVNNPADVIVSLSDGYFSGSAGFSKMVKVASTHGSLNRRNSTTFIMSSIGPLPDLMETQEIPAQMKKLTGREFPEGK